LPIRPIPIEATRRIAPHVASIIRLDALIRAIRVIRDKAALASLGFLASGSNHHPELTTEAP
jgi:hypothetical protein